MMRRATTAIAGLLLLAGACSGGGGGNDEAASTTVPAVEGPSGVSVTTTTTPGDLETFEVFSTKNPFTPLAGDQTGGGGTGGTTPPSSGGGTGGGSTGGGTSGGGSTGGGGTGGGTTDTTPSVEPQRAQRVALLDVFSENGEVMANVRVSSTVYKVGVGDTFAGRYKVLSLDGATECGRFLFGDDAFRLCKGEQALK